MKEFVLGEKFIHRVIELSQGAALGTLHVRLHVSGQVTLSLRLVGALAAVEGGSFAAFELLVIVQGLLVLVGLDAHAAPVQT
jgi:hypothetical protein